MTGDSIRNFLTSVLLWVAVAMPVALPASAQEGAGSGLLDRLLGELRGGNGKSGEQAAPAPQAPVPQADVAAQPSRRVPFGEREIQLSFAPLVKQTAPAVVNVYASQQVQARSPFMGDPFFEQFFGRQRMSPRVQSSLGSGVLVDASGLVVTNFHVIRDADKVRVALSDGREYESRILLKDESLDLAVLKIDGNGAFPVLPIGDSDALEVGDLVLAIGNPFGVGQTTTSGIVSALARNHVGVADFGFFIQTDAAINPGNSGGALIDMNGNLIGINTAIFSQGGGSNGVGFAIPSNMVRAVVASARDGSDVFERPFIGAQFELVTPQIAEALGMNRPVGALVADVPDDGPAGKAGLRPGDVVISMNGAPIEHVDALGYRLATQPIGSVARLGILRQGAEKTIEVTLEKAPKADPAATVMLKGQSPFAGATVAQLTPLLASKLGMPSSLRGVAMITVAPGSPAASFGFRPRDIVREVNGTAIDSIAALQGVVEARSRWWRFTVERDGQAIQQVLRF